MMGREGFPQQCNATNMRMLHVRATTAKTMSIRLLPAAAVASRPASSVATVVAVKLSSASVSLGWSDVMAAAGAVVVSIIEAQCVVEFSENRTPAIDAGLVFRDESCERAAWRLAKRSLTSRRRKRAQLHLRDIVAASILGVARRFLRTKLALA